MLEVALRLDRYVLPDDDPHSPKEGIRYDGWYTGGVRDIDQRMGPDIHHIQTLYKQLWAATPSKKLKNWLTASGDDRYGLPRMSKYMIAENGMPY